METEYKVRLEIFEGPLDLLLYLIKRDELDIYDISLERITQQYLEYLQAFKELNIDVAGEFVVMAANLIYLKSRSLLPADLQPPEEDVDEDDPRWIDPAVDRIQKSRRPPHTLQARELCSSPDLRIATASCQRSHRIGEVGFSADQRPNVVKHSK